MDAAERRGTSDPEEGRGSTMGLPLQQVLWGYNRVVFHSGLIWLGYSWDVANEHEILVCGRWCLMFSPHKWLYLIFASGTREISCNQETLRN